MSGGHEKAPRSWQADAGQTDVSHIGDDRCQSQPFTNHRDAALMLLNGPYRLTWKAGSFLGQLAVDPSPMSIAQANWLAKLLEREGLPPLAEGGAS